ELINLVPRKAVFFRGANKYDTKLVGLDAPERDPHNTKLYFKFHTAMPGNSNKGHDYPWKADEVGRDEQKKNDLKALLEYLTRLYLLAWNMSSSPPRGMTLAEWPVTFVPFSGLLAAALLLPEVLTPGGTPNLHWLDHALELDNPAARPVPPDTPLL